MIEKFKRATFEILEVSKPGYKYQKISKYVDIIIFTLIILNVFAVVISTVDNIYERLSLFFRWFEIFSIAIFSVEYLLRLWSCDYEKELYYKDYQLLEIIKNKAAFVFSKWGIIDLLAILPFYLPFINVLDLRLIRLLRILRIIRVLKLGRYTRSISSLGMVLKDKREELLTTICFIGILILISSTILYYAEHSIQPEVFSSIPAALWWGVATLTTVGYGDIYPITVLGKVFASFIALCGIGVVALPSGFLASGLVEQFEKEQRGYIMAETLKDHIVICGWNFMAEGIIKMLLSKEIDKMGIEKVVVLANMEHKPEVLEQMGYNVFFVKGNPTREHDLLKAGIRNCHTALLLLDFTLSNPDAEALLVALAVQATQSDIYICAQLHDAANKKHFENIGVQEIVCIEELTCGVSIGSTVHHGLSNFVNELLTFNETSGIYKTNMLLSLQDLNFSQAAACLMKKDMLLIGIERQKDSVKQIMINPDKDMMLHKDDSLFLISREFPQNF